GGGSRSAGQGAAALPLDRIWLDFRDSFGALWAARVQQRLNASATDFGWPVVLSLGGFHSSVNADKLDKMPPQVAGAVEHALRSLLWRFVSPQWMDERLALPPRR